MALVLSSSVVESSGSLLGPNDASQLDMEEASLDWHWFPNAFYMVKQMIVHNCGLLATMLDMVVNK